MTKDQKTELKKALIKFKPPKLIKGTRRRYSEEMKERILHLKSIGIPRAIIGKKFGIAPDIILRWKSNHKNENKISNLKPRRLNLVNDGQQVRNQNLTNGRIILKNGIQIEISTSDINLQLLTLLQSC